MGQPPEVSVLQGPAADHTETAAPRLSQSVSWLSTPSAPPEHQGL